MNNVSKLVVSTTALAFLATSQAAYGQAWQVISQYIELQAPSRVGRIIFDTEQATNLHSGTDLIQLAGDPTGQGLIQIDGSARVTTAWDTSAISWSTRTTIDSLIWDMFEPATYEPISLQATTLLELRFEVFEPIQVQLTRTPNPSISDTSPNDSAYSQLSPSTLVMVDQFGFPIDGTLITINGSETRSLSPGMYLATLNAASYFSSGASGGAPIEGTSTLIDGGRIQIVPTPGVFATALIATTFAMPRRRRTA